MNSKRSCTSKSMPRFSAARRCLLTAAAVVSFFLSWRGERISAAEAETNVTAATASETSNQETLRAYLQRQEQLHLTQLAVEQNRKEARETAVQNSELLSGRLQTIEKALESQRSRELQEMQNSNRSMLFVAGSFAGIGFLAMFLMSFFQWRTANRLAEISGSLPATLALGQGQGRNPGPTEAHVVTVGPA